MSTAQQSELSSDFTKAFYKSDVTFVFDDNSRLYFNRAFLSFLSPVFDELFSGKWSETAIPNQEISLPGKSSADFLTLLRFLKKSGDTDFVSEENVEVLLKLGDEYLIESVLVECRKWIELQWLNNPDKYMKVVSLASQYRLKSLLNRLVPLAAMRSVDEINEFAPQIASNVLAAMFQCRTLRQTELMNDSSWVLECYPHCVHPANWQWRVPFKCGVCFQCGVNDCHVGICDYGDVQSSCHHCDSRVTVLKPAECPDCDKVRFGAGELCVCDADLEAMLEDEVVAMLLSRKA